MRQVNAVDYIIKLMQGFQLYCTQQTQRVLIQFCLAQSQCVSSRVEGTHFVMQSPEDYYTPRKHVVTKQALELYEAFLKKCKGHMIRFHH